MDKIKTNTSGLTNWEQKFPGPKVCSDKLDGVSALLVFQKTELETIINLYTRGDGLYGQDITCLMPYLKLPSGFSGRRYTRRRYTIESPNRKRPKSPKMGYTCRIGHDKRELPKI